jgi:hypothetical protein
LCGFKTFLLPYDDIRPRRTTQVPKKKATQEELAGEIKKLKEKAKAAKEKAGGKRSDPALRKARKKVKRAQRKLRVVKAYKTVSKQGKKGGEAA